MSVFKAHRVAALFVLVAAGAWVATGEFAAVGSQQAEPAAEAAAPAEPAAPLIRTVAATVPEFADHARQIRLSGATEPDKRAVLAARTDGIINSLSLAKGEDVAADTVVMTVEGPEILAAAKIAQIALDQRNRELAVAERLYAGGNTPETQVTSARSDRDAAEAELNRARAAVDRLELKAPFAGLVDSVEVELGEYVQQGAPIATILSLDPIVVRAEVSELDVGFVEPGAKAGVTLVNGMKMEGTVRFVAGEASAQTRTFPIEVALPNPDRSIPSGMTAEVSIYTDPVRTVTIPRSVITLSDKGEIGVRVVGNDNLARFAAVQMIDDTPDGLIVTGVPDGVRIIVAGQDLVQDGEQVIVADPPVASE